MSELEFNAAYLDAAIAVRSFAGNVGRYVMTSTIDAWPRCLERLEAELDESLGPLAELLAGCLLPLLLLVILRADQDDRRVIVPLSVLVAAAWLTNAPSAVMVNYSLALMIVITAIVLVTTEVDRIGEGAQQPRADQLRR